MLCMTIALCLVGESSVQAFEMAEHASLHAADATLNAPLEASDRVDAAKDGGVPTDLAGEDHHHPADHHSVGLLTDMATAEPGLLPGQGVAPASGLRRTGLAGYGIERPPKA